MSKPDATSAKSLEEIIASIRRSLAGDGGSSGRNGHARADPVLPELPPLGSATGLDALLSDRLAGALNGGNGAGADDDDLADILAHDPDKGARLAAKPLDPAGEPGGRWFAGHVLAEPSREVSREKAPAPVQTPEASAEPAADQIELSRPELLRASLPPLFGDEMEATGKPEPESGGDGDAKRPAFAAPQAEEAAVPEAAPEKPAESPAAALPAFASALLSLSSLPASGGPALAEPAPVVPPPILSVAPAPATPPPPPPFIAADARATDAASRDAVANPASGDHNGAAHAAPAGGPGTRTLEQVIAELLEPVIRHWLDNNLPRMVEKVVREEVARSLAAERAAPKADA